MTRSISLTLPITIRPALAEDLPRLEWFGEMTPLRLLNQAHFARSQKGDTVYLVADFNDFPIAQIVTDLVHLQKEEAGYISALRVLRPFQGLGIAKQLLAEIETVILQNGLTYAQLNVVKTNKPAKRLYKNAGYRIIGEETEPWQYPTPSGEIITVTDIEWVMQKNLEE